MKASKSEAVDAGNSEISGRAKRFLSASCPNSEAPPIRHRTSFLDLPGGEYLQPLI